MVESALTSEESAELECVIQSCSDAPRSRSASHFTGRRRSLQIATQYGLRHCPWKKIQNPLPDREGQRDVTGRDGWLFVSVSRTRIPNQFLTEAVHPSRMSRVTVTGFPSDGTGPDGNPTGATSFLGGGTQLSDSDSARLLESATLTH